MRIEVLSRAKKKKFVEALGDFGIDKIPQMLVRAGKEKIRAFSGDLDKGEILDLWRVLPVEGIGLYVGKDVLNRKSNVREVRPTIDGLHVWKDKIKGRILDLNEEQERVWFVENEVELTKEQGEIGVGFVAVRSNMDFVGVGKVNADCDKLFGFLPKERRRRERMS